MRPRRSACFHSDGPTPSRSRTIPPLTNRLSVRSSKGPRAAPTTATAAYSSPRCAVCGPCAGPAQ
eukprot:4100008-Lingulodinium_polyedra.AAC.1